MDMKEELLSQLKLVFDIMADDKFTDAVADFCWNLYQKLVKKGFSEDQAMKIVSGFAKSSNK